MKTSKSGFKGFRDADIIKMPVGPIGEVKEYQLPADELEKIRKVNHIPRDRWGQPIKKPINGGGIA